MPDMPQSEVDALGGFRMIASRYGGSPQSILQKIEDLEKDNRDQRDEIRTLKEKQPKEGEVVLPKSQADRLAAYEALGKPDELKTRLENGTKAAAELEQTRHRESAAKFVKAAGLADETVDTLVAIPALQGAKFEVRTVKVKNDKGEEVEQPEAYVTLAGENQAAKPFKDIREEVPALKGLAAAKPAQEDKGTPPPPRTYFSQGKGEQEDQGTSGSKKDLSPLDAAIKRNREAAENNPLRPKQKL